MAAVAPIEPRVPAAGAAGTLGGTLRYGVTQPQTRAVPGPSAGRRCWADKTAALAGQRIRRARLERRLAAAEVDRRVERAGRNRRAGTAALAGGREPVALRHRRLADAVGDAAAVVTNTHG